MTIFFFLLLFTSGCYILLHLLNTPAIGAISWAWLFALTQFVMTWVLCGLYAKKAAKFDNYVSALKMNQEVMTNEHDRFILFVAIVGLTLVITYFAAKKLAMRVIFTQQARGLTGFQNGLAIAGDYMSAASFLDCWHDRVKRI